MSYALFPTPRKVMFGKEVLDLTNARWIKVAPGLSARIKAHARALVEGLAGGFRAPVQVTAGEPAAGGVLLTVNLVKRGFGPEAYKATATAAGIELTAGDEAGLFHGLQTLRQLLRQTGGRVPAFTIEDSPDFPRRGIMLDVSRCKVPKMDTLYAIVDLMAQLKLNQLQLYTEHTFAFSEHEAVWHDASPMTPQEVLALDAYCADRYIELVPNLNSFGHFERWLRHPEYKHLAECPDGFARKWGARSPHGTTLRPNRNSLRFLDSLYREFLPNFTSPLFNVGCDETWELGQGWSKKRCEQRGNTRVYLDFLLGIHKLVQKHDRTMMFWGDIILHQPELIGELPKDIIALEWGYSAKHDFNGRCRHFKQAGVPFYVCPGTSTWQSLTGRLTNAIGNLRSAARYGLRHGAVGYLNTDWGDRGHHQYLPISYPGYLTGAALSWCAKANDDADLAGALDRMVFHDRTGTLGKLVCDLGRVLELVPRDFGNKTVYQQLLFYEIGNREMLKGVTAASLRKSVARFHKLEEQLADARPEAPDGELVKAELRNAITMARHGAERGLAGREPGKWERAAMRPTLQHIIRRHQELWLARNRPGGLAESTDYLRARLQDYD